MSVSLCFSDIVKDHQLLRIYNCVAFVGVFLFLRCFAGRRVSMKQQVSVPVRLRRTSVIIGLVLIGFSFRLISKTPNFSSFHTIVSILSNQTNKYHHHIYLSPLFPVPCSCKHQQHENQGWHDTLLSGFHCITTLGSWFDVCRDSDLSRLCKRCDSILF